MPIWTPERAKKYVIRLARKHALEDAANNTDGGMEMSDDELRELASEGFWNVVFVKLENQCVDPNAKVDGETIERHYILATLEAYAELKKKVR